MKIKLFIMAFLFCYTMMYSQSKFNIGFGLNEQFVKKDMGVNTEGFLSYNINTDISLVLSAANAKMKNDELDVKYNLSKYALQVNYDFAKSETSKFESVFGFSYLNFDKKLELDDNNGLGLDLGVQTMFGLDKRLHYGLRIISTYSSISPGAILNAGILFKYNL